MHSVPPSVSEPRLSAIAAWKLEHGADDSDRSGYVFVLAVWPSRSALQRCRETFESCDNRAEGSTRAFFEQEPRTPGNRFLGTLHVSLDDLEVSTIAHECVHVAKEAGARIGTRREEFEAYGTQTCLRRCLIALKRKREIASHLVLL
jgi:hypothetical protein